MRRKELFPGGFLGSLHTSRSKWFLYIDMSYDKTKKLEQGHQRSLLILIFFRVGYDDIVWNILINDEKIVRLLDVSSPLGYLKRNTNGRSMKWNTFIF